MSTRSLNKVMLIGNLTRDPELRYTPQGTAVCSLGLATNRGWTTESGEKREEAEFHRLVAWNKLAELCSQLLTKGRKVYVEGRLQTRTWQAQDGTQRTTTEIVIDDMIILDSRRPLGEPGVVGETTVAEGGAVPAVHEEIASPAGEVSKPVVVSDQTVPVVPAATTDEGKKKRKTATTEKTEKADEVKDEQINPDDIPF